MFHLLFSKRPSGTLITRGKVSAIASLKLEAGRSAAEAAALPTGITSEAWVHAHCASALDTTEAIWAVVEERCGCAKAATAGVLEYRFADAKGAFVSLPARLYVSRIIAGARAALAEASVFPPAESEGPFPPAFLPAAK